MFDPGWSTGRLDACPFWERGARCLVGKFFVRVLDEAAAFFGGRTTRELSYRRRTCEPLTPYV